MRKAKRPLWADLVDRADLNRNIFEEFDTLGRRVVESRHWTGVYETHAAHWLRLHDDEDAQRANAEHRLKHVTVWIAGAALIVSALALVVSILALNKP